MTSVEQYNQEPASIRIYFYALIAIVLIVIAGTASFLFWIDFQSQKTIQTSNKFHLAVIIHVNNIKHDLQQMDGLLVHGEMNRELANALFSPDIAHHLARIDKNIKGIFILREKYGEEFKETISEKLRSRFNQLKSRVEKKAPGAIPDYGPVRQMFRIMGITLLQLESLHLTVNSENLEAYRHQKGGTIRGFLALVVGILVIGLGAIFRALGRINQILKERIEDRLSLRETNLFLSSILESSSKISIMATDLKGMITYWNKGAEHMFEYSSDEVVGKESVNILYPEGTETKDVVSEAASRILVSGESSVNCEVREKTKSGKIIWVHLELSKRTNVDNEVEGILGIGIASRKEVE